MKGDWILRALARILTVCSVLSSGALAVAQSDSSGVSEVCKVCSNRTLFGDYGAKIEGTILGPPDLALRTLVLFHFEGDGNMTEVDHVVLNGMPPAEEWRPTSGTYTVNPNCTGSAVITVSPGEPPLAFHFIVVKHGKEFFLVVDGGAISGVGDKVE
jgi:hypothetical protein